MLPQILPWFMAVLVAWSVFTDIRGYIIPNWIPLAVAALAVAQILALGLGWSAWPLLAAGLAVLLVGFVLFAFNLLGAGDAKLLAALGLWAGPAGVPGLIAWTAVGGGALSLAVLALDRARGRRAVNTGPACAASTEEPVRLESSPDSQEYEGNQGAEGKRQIPYAAAIACGVLYLFVYQHGLV